MDWTRNRLVASLVVLSLGVTACVAAPGSSSTQTAATGAETTQAESTTSTTRVRSGSCGSSSEGVPWDSEVVATSELALESDGTGPKVELVRYPRPDYQGKPWSQWGQGLVADDGRFFSAIGDHHGADGNSFIYEYDPATRTLTRIVEILDVVPHVAGEWGFGKVHAQMVEGACGEIYVSTYWGTRRDLTFTESYQGDVLLRLDPGEQTVENLGVILPEHGVASLAATPDGSLLYAEPADPFGQKVGSFIALDPITGDVLFEDDDISHGGYRSIAVNADGSAFITWNDSSLAKYDPATNTLTDTGAVLPGDILRAATEPDAGGRVYAVSRDPAVFFAIEPDGSISDLSPARGYTTSMALSPDGSSFFYVPDAHGGSWEQGTPLISVDTTTGEETVIVELNPLVEDMFGLRAGGTYSVAVGPDGKTVYVGLNSGDPAERQSFGEIILAVVTLP